ncbi:MAG TPA: non-homologous end-joining DNA ligase [Fimbriimonadaceae bacterium]|jgi:bifunctional non-homologous end joining protein LigD
MKKLSEYEAKREFSVTPEPGPELETGRKGPLLFVIQKHNATRLHYDLRLELDGVLKSWAVPKGFSYNPEEKHMAVAVEDHPFDYGSFEGIIPKGQYGGGEVIVWDTGAYWCDEDDDIPCRTREENEEAVRKGLKDGKLSFFLRGSKLKGSWALVKMKQENDWLLLKHKDRYANWKDNVLEEGDSAISGFSIEDLKRGEKLPPRLKAEDLVPYRKFEAFPKKLFPMKASLADHPFDDPDWVFEPKLDGIRVLIFIEGDEVKLMSRNNLDLSSQFPAIRENLKEQFTRGMVLDGEIVAFENGRPSFNSMLKRLHLKDAAMLNQMDSSIPCILYVFDLLHFEGVDLRGRQLNDRRRYLEQQLLPTDLIQLISQVPEEGIMLYTAVIKNGLEGVVAKRANSVYEQGKRSNAWLKLKHTLSSEFVVGGYSKGEGNRNDSFGALLVGKYEDGKLVYKGNVGTGFNETNLPLIKDVMDALKVKENPFSAKLPLTSPVTWIEPKLVAEVKFHEMTPAGIMRAPVFLRLRDDIDPKDVGLDKPAVHIAAQAEEKPKGGTKTKNESMIESVIDQLDNKTADLKLELGGDIVSVTSLNKPLWPANPELGFEPFTKRDLLIYLAKVSESMIPHLQDRPLTMIRFPEGIHGEKFFQKHWEQKKPDYVESVSLYSGSKDENQTYLLVNNLPTLLWLGQLGTLEFHVWGSRSVGGDDAAGLGFNFTDSEENIESSVLNYPDFIKFDLDPYVYSGKEAAGAEPELNKEGFDKGVTVAFWLKELLDSMGLNSFVKTTGKTGLHIFVPIVRNLDYDAVKAIAETFSRNLELAHPKDITTEWSTKKRTGKIFMDYNMNVRSKTLGSAYCPRALPNQGVGMPVTWEELPNVYPDQFTMRSVPDILAQRHDIWANMLDAKKDLSAFLG